MANAGAADSVAMATTPVVANAGTADSGAMGTAPVVCSMYYA